MFLQGRGKIIEPVGAKTLPLGPVSQTAIAVLLSEHISCSLSEY